MKKYFVVPALVVLAGLILGGPSWSQQAAQPFPYPAAVQVTQQLQTQQLQNAAARSEIAQLVKQLGEAEDSAKKADLTKALEVAVAKSFDRDMEDREADLTKLEERVKKLHAQLDRRRKAKDDIIQLQTKVLVNEAEGLGFGGQPFQPGASPKTTTRSGSSAIPSSPVAPGRLAR